MDYIDRAAIDGEAYDLQKRVWRRRDELLRLAPRSPLERFDSDEERQTNYLISLMRPEIACRLLGVTVLYRDSLGMFGYGRGQRFECAGSIDRDVEAGAATIAISRAFQPEQQHFTSGHELGHFVLHPGEVRHRDRPVSGPSRGADLRNRPRVEREADRFSGSYVMPATLVLQEFEHRFGRKPLKLSEHSAWALDHQHHHRLINSDPASLDFECAVARSSNFNGNGRKSLHLTFKVSVTAMAMRLEDLRVLER